MADTEIMGTDTSKHNTTDRCDAAYDGGAVISAERGLQNARELAVAVRNVRTARDSQTAER